MGKRRGGKDETDDERKRRQAREVADYENAHDLVGGTAHHQGDGKGQGPAGGTLWEGAARMAAARSAARVRLNGVDREALDRYPNPTGYIGSE